jgi:beta-phosphoglucomutase
MDLKACIFDLDGVIVDTAKYHFQSWNRLASELNIAFNEEINEGLKGVSRMKSLQTILSLGNRSLPEEEMTALATRKNDWFIEMVDQMTPEEILPGVTDFLDELDRNGIIYAVGSASKNARRALEKVHLLNRFHSIVDGTMVENAKPDPEVFLLAADLMGIRPENCVVFEDAKAGVEAAQNGGMRCIGIGDSLTLQDADLVIDDFTSLSVKDVSTLLD